MVQFKSSHTLAKQIKQRILNNKEHDTPFEKLLQSPTNENKYQDRNKAPLIYSYQSTNSQANSECLPGRKNKARVKMDENQNPRKNEKFHHKKSFEGYNGNSSPQNSNRFINQLLSFKDIMNDKYYKPNRPSVGYGSSPQASSTTSSKYCFSNRSSNLSAKQQQLPESIHHKPIQIQQQKLQSGGSRLNQKKTTNSTSTNVLGQNNQVILQGNRPQVMNLNRQQSPSTCSHPQANLTIADENYGSQLKQAIVETPKFNQYYTLLGKHHTKITRSNTRSKSLVKSQILQCNSITNNYDSNLNQYISNQNQNSYEDQFDQEVYYQLNNENTNLNVNVKVQVQNDKQFYRQNTATNNNTSQQDQNYNMMASFKQSRFFMQSHSSCSHHDDQVPNDPQSSQVKKRRNKVIKLKKSDIKFQQDLLKLKNGQNNTKISNGEGNQAISPKQYPRYSKVKTRKATIDQISFPSTGGIMIGSPKMQQKQQQAKNQCESSILSSQSSNMSDNEDIKISYIKNANQINQLQFSREAVENYQQYLNQDYNQTSKANKQAKNVKKSKQVKQLRNHDETQIVAKAVPKFSKVQFINMNSYKINDIINDYENQQSQFYQNENTLFKTIERAISGSSTYREYSNKGQTRLQDEILPTLERNDHFSIAKSEFLQISGLKSQRQQLDKSQQSLMQTQQKSFSNKISFNKQEMAQATHSSPFQLQTLDSIEQSGNKFQELVKMHKAQSSYIKPRLSVMHDSNIIDNDCFSRRIKVMQENFMTNILLQSDRSGLINILGNGCILEKIIILLSPQEMCRLSVIFNHKRLGQILKTFNIQYNNWIRRQSSSQVINIWRERYIPRIITNDLSYYFSTLSTCKSQYDFEIEKDIERTFPNDLYFSKTSQNYNKMLKILRAVAYHMPQVGYVQGFNFIVGSLLKLLKNEEQVFWMFVNILSWKNLYQLYTDGMPLLKLMQYQLNCFVQNLLPEVELYLSKRNILLEYFSSQWFLTLFSFDFGLDFFMYFLNQMLQYGPQFMIQLSLALINYISSDLMKKHSMEDAMEYLKDFPQLINLDIFEIFQSALEFTQVTPQRLEELKQIYRTNKNKKRVLFVKDQDQDITILKTLPNLPDDEQMTECNVEEDSDDQNDNEEEYSPSLKNNNKRQINNSFYLNNVSQMEIRPNSGLDSIKDRKTTSRLFRYLDNQDTIEDQDVQLILEESESDSVKDMRFEDYQFYSNQSNDRTRLTKLNQNIQSTNKLPQVNEYQAQIDDLSDSTPMITYQRVLTSRFGNQKSAKNSNIQSEIKNREEIAILKIQQNQNQNNPQIMSKLKQESTVKHQKKLSEELLHHMSRRRFMHSPSVDNLRSSFKLNQKRQSKVSVICTPNSEDIAESERKPVKHSQNRIQIDQFNNNLIVRKQKSIENLAEFDIQDPKVDESHNISNIEEFACNELDYQSVNDKFQNTQRYTTKRDHREDLSERETLKLSWTKTRQFAKGEMLHVQQFELDKKGSHLSTPYNQQTNRSNTILQEKRINNPVNSFDLRRTNRMTERAHLINENQDPNQYGSHEIFQAVNSMRQGGHSLQRSQLISQINHSQEEISNSQKNKVQAQSINNFYRFSATQKNPQSKLAQKNLEKQRNKILHNWSANNNNNHSNNNNNSNYYKNLNRDSSELKKQVQMKSSEQVEEVIKSMKTSHIAYHVTKVNRLPIKLTAINTQFNNIPLSGRDDVQSLSHRSQIQKNSGYLQINGDCDSYYQKGMGNGGAANSGQNILSPRTVANQKQSSKLVVHKGDNFFEEAELTTIVTPKESFYGAALRLNSQVLIN